MVKNGIVIKGSEEFRRMLDEVRLERIRNGKNKKMVSYKRLTLAISRIPNVKKILMESEIKDAK